MNLLKIPVDVLFSVLVEVPTIDLTNWSCSCKQGNKLFNDQRFWKRKIEKDYGEVGWKRYNYKCVKELYKRLYLKYGQLVELINNKKSIVKVDFLVRKIIPGNIVYVIDSNYNLRILTWVDEPLVFDDYLISLVGDNISFVRRPLLKNVKDLVRNDSYGLILTTNNNVYHLEDVKREVPVELETDLLVGTEKRLVRLASNVKEIGGDFATFYYVNRDSELYVKSDQVVYDCKLKTFTCIGRVKSVCLSNGYFYYTDMDNKSFSGLETESEIKTRIGVLQLIVRGNVWYVLTEQGFIDGYDFNKEMRIAFSIGDARIDKLYFEGRTSPVYAVSKNLESFDITKYDKTHIFGIMTNTLSICKDYFILLPSNDDPFVCSLPNLSSLDEDSSVDDSD